MKKVICLLAVLAIIGLSYVYKESVAGEREPNTSAYTQYLTSEQEAELEDKISQHLLDASLFQENQMNIKVSTGGENTQKGLVNKTRVHIILDGSLADDKIKAETLADGYYAALILYFGADEIEEYDVHVQFAGRYEFINNKLVEE